MAIIIPHMHYITLHILRTIIITEKFTFNKISLQNFAAHSSVIICNYTNHHSPEAGQSAQLAGLAHGVVGGDPMIPPALDVSSHDVVTYLGLALVSSS